jgi:predicted permease
MIRSYFVSAWRNLTKNKTLSIINLCGLAVGMTFTLLIGLWIRHELSFDKFHADSDRIGMIMKNVTDNDRRNTGSSVPLPLYDALKSSYPEIESISRLITKSYNLRFNNRILVKPGYFADPAFVEMFSFKWKSGDHTTALNKPASIVLTQSLATALFANEDPIGKILRVDNKFDLEVTGIVEDVPSNSTLQFQFLVPFEFNILSDPSVAKRLTWWGDNFVQNLVKLKPGISAEEFSARIVNIIRDTRNDTKEGYLFLHPMPRWHLYNMFTNWVNTGGRIEYVRLFGAIGVLILMIACINFMNLATARSEKRIKEVGIRKAIGSRRGQIAGQFLAESLLTVFVAFIMSLVLANLVLPMISDLGFRNITLEEVITTNAWLIVALLAACIVTGMAAGSYPAFYLSSFKPVRALKGIAKAGTGTFVTRKVLVVIQFTFSIALVIATIVVFRQVQHAKDRPLGYDPNNLMSIPATDDLKKNFAPMKEELLTLSVVEAVSKSASPMTQINSAWRDFTWEGMDPDGEALMSVIMTEYDYEKTSRINIIQGRAFSRIHASDSSAVMINESALGLTGFKEPIGATINFGDEKLTVIGVVQDVVMQNPFNPVRPAIYMFNPDRVSDISIRLKDGEDIASAVAAVQEIVEKYDPADPFQYQFVDDVFNLKFELETQVGKLAGLFAALAMFISSLGVFGLVSFMSEQRIKEIGIRKILGASIASLWSLLSSGFLKLVVVSFMLATPLSWYFLNAWLAKYIYRTELSWWIFALAGTTALAITILTVSFQAIKAAIANPVKNLRSE